MTARLTGAAGLLLLAGATLAARQDAVFRANADFVAVDVSVRQGGRPVSGLAARDFEIRDNGALQEVADLTYQQLPIDVVVALDVSGSVAGSVLDELRRALLQVRADLAARDRLKLVTFNMRIRELVGFDAPPDAMDSALNRLSASGNTMVFDTIAVALTSSSSADRRQLVVVLSDGQDSGSITDAGTLFDVARHTTPTLDVILASSLPSDAVVSARSLPATEASRQMYSDLARETGGLVFTVDVKNALSTTFRRMLEEFRSSYVLHFIPSGVERRGAHTLDVRVKRPGVDVRARRGYVIGS
jgi:VWFA-related protein